MIFPSTFIADVTKSARGAVARISRVESEAKTRCGFCTESRRLSGCTAGISAFVVPLRLRRTGLPQSFPMGRAKRFIENMLMIIAPLSSFFNHGHTHALIELIDFRLYCVILDQITHDGLSVRAITGHLIRRRDNTGLNIFPKGFQVGLRKFDWGNLRQGLLLFDLCHRQKV